MKPDPHLHCDVRAGVSEADPVQQPLLADTCPTSINRERQVTLLSGH